MLTHASGATRPIHGVVGLRATAPALPTLRAGDLVVMSVAETEAIDDTLTPAVIVARLAGTTVGGLAVIGAIDESARQAANRQGLTLLCLPATVDTRTVIREVSLLLESPDIQIERRAAQLYSQLTSYVARGEGITGVLRTVSHATGCAAAFYDAASQIQSQFNVNGEHAVLTALNPQQTARVYAGEFVILVQAIGNTSSHGEASVPTGFIALCGHEIDRWDEVAAEQAASALMLELAKQQAVEAVETRVGGELLQTIMSGMPSDMLALQEHASELGYDLRRSHVAIMIASADNHLTMPRLRERLEHELRLQRTNAPYVERDHSILCMYPTDERLMPSAGDATQTRPGLRDQRRGEQASVDGSGMATSQFGGRTGSDAWTLLIRRSFDHALRRRTGVSFVVRYAYVGRSPTVLSGYPWRAGRVRPPP